MTSPKTPFFIYSPGGNITALIETARPMDFSAVAARVMEQRPEVEQVGFVMPPKKPLCDFHVEMMGGEFCGNAARSAALRWCLSAKKNSAVFTVSGFDVPLTAHVQDKTVTLRIPGEFLKSAAQVPEGWLADFYGIRFLVIDNVTNKKDIEKLVHKYRDSMPAIGVIVLQASEKGHSIIPWVWVVSTGTLIKENACASGSIAAALVVRKQGLDLPSYSIIQPSGSVLSVGLEPRFLDVTLSGIVEFVSERGFIEILFDRNILVSSTADDNNRGMDKDQPAITLSRKFPLIW